MKLWQKRATSSSVFPGIEVGPAFAAADGHAVSEFLKSAQTENLMMPR